jgi:hypothetical protein
MKKAIVIAAALVALTAFMPAASAQKSGGELGISFPIIAPVGSFDDWAGVGIGGLLRGGYNINETVGLFLTTGYFYHVARSGQYCPSGGDYCGSANFNWSTVPLLVGAQVSFLKKSWRPYVSADLGLFYNRGTISGPRFSYTYTEADFGFDVNLGVKYWWNEHVNFSLQVGFMDYDVTQFSDTMSIITTLGIGYMW